MSTSAEARVVASFTFIVALMLGAWGALDRMIAGPPTLLFSEQEFGVLVVALVPFVATAVAFQATNAAQAAWARTLGSAAVLLGGLSCLGAVLYFVTNT